MDESHADEERQKVAGEENPQSDNRPAHDLGVAPHEGPNPEERTNKPKTLEERVTQLEEATAVEFIRREARFIPSLMNFWTHFRVFGGRTDPKSRAALSSLLWRVFSPATATAAAGGALMVLFTGLQIVLVAKQNAKLDQQTHVMQAQSNVTVLAQLGPLSDSLIDYAEKACIKIDPLSAEVLKHPVCWIEMPAKQRSSWLRTCSLLEICRDQYRVERAVPKRPVDQQGEGALVETTIPLPARVQRQVVSFTQAARPYRFIDTLAPLVDSSQRRESASAFEKLRQLALPPEDVPVLVERPLSPERGVLLELLLRLGYSMDSTLIASADFSSAYVKGLGAEDIVWTRGFDRVSLPFARFGNARLGGSLFQSDLRCADFEGADLSAATVVGGDYSGAYFTITHLPRAESFNPASLASARFNEAIVQEADFLAKMAEKGIPGFDPQVWEVKEEVWRGSKVFRVHLRAKTAVSSQSICGY
jgi:hypothetical protein